MDIGAEPQGRIDAVTSSGTLEGWACDPACATRPARICIRDASGREVASGFAHRYRPDLAEAGIGLGWCAFRLRADRSPSRLRAARLSLFCDQGATALHEAESLPLIDVSEPIIAFPSDIFAADPTICQYVTQLEGCAQLLDRFLQTRGSVAFVRTAYLYLFSRRADPTGLAFYVGLFEANELLPSRLLARMADSDEFRASPRLLAAPNTPEFPFHCD